MNFLNKIISNIHGLLIKIFPPNPHIPRAGNIYVETLGLLGLFLYLANINLQSDLFSTGEILLGISFLLAWKQLRILLSQPIFWLMLLWVLAVAASAISGMYKFPFVDSLEQLDEARKMALYALLVPIGWWIGPNLTSIRNALLITCLGFVISALPWILDWNTLGAMLEGKRPGRDILGFWTNQYATWTGLLLLAVALTNKDLLPESLKNQKKIFLGYAILIILAVCLALGVYVPLTRTVWIATFLSFPFSFILYMITSPHKKETFYKGLVTTIVIFLILIAIGLSQFDKIKERFLEERATMEKAIKGEWDQIERTNIGTRIHLYCWALSQDNYITLFGWGPIAAETISEHEELRNMYNWPPKQHHPHLHNDLLEILFRTGILGTLVMSLTLFYFIKGITTTFRKNITSRSLYVFFLTGIFFLILTGLTTFALRTHTLVGSFGGFMFAYILSYLQIQETAKQSKSHSSTNIS